MALNEVGVMRGRYFWFIVVLTGLTVVGQPATWAYRASDRPAKTSVEFQLYRDYLIVVQGSVGPLKGLNFLLDTGATTTVLDPQLARKLHLDTAPTDVAVLSGSVKGGIATAPSLQFGPVRKDNVRVLVENLSFIQNALPFQIDAIVGLDVLGQSTFVIDYSSREIRFGPVRAMPDSIPLQFKNGLAFVDAVVNHTTVRLLVDSAAPSLVIFDELPNPESGLKGEQPSPKRIGDYDRKRVQQFSLRLGNVEFGQESAFVVPNLRDPGHDFDGLMSPAALGISRIAVDLNQRTLAFERQ
ncbi:MAG: retropepsin-like aspartic protease [Terracidiphilus sp.]